MKILVISPFYPPHTGGLESHSDEFNKYLAQKGVGITVFTPRLPADASAREERYPGVEIIRFPAFELIHNYPLPRFWTAEFWRLWHDLHRIETDLVISRTRFFFTSLMTWRYARKRRLPWVHIEHGSDYTRFNSAFKTALGKLYDHIFGRFVLRHSDRNIANSLASAGFVKHLSGRTDCQVIYRGIERDILNSALPASEWREKYPDQVIISFIGRLIDGKGVRDLLKAFLPLVDVPFVCFIVGEGPERVPLERFSRENGLEERVIFFGRRVFREAMSLLKVSDISVNPSYNEGIPTSVIEAAFFKKAIVATKVGGTPEIITGEGDGFLVPPKDVAVLTEKLDLLLSDSRLRQNFGERAYQAVREKFDWPEAAEKYRQSFEELLSSKTR